MKQINYALWIKNQCKYKNVIRALEDEVEVVFHNLE